MSISVRQLLVPTVDTSSSQTGPLVSREVEAPAVSAVNRLMPDAMLEAPPYAAIGRHDRGPVVATPHSLAPTRLNLGGALTNAAAGAFSPCGTLTLTGHFDGTVRLRGLTAGAPMTTVAVGRGWCSALDVDARQRRAVAMTDAGELTLFAIPDGEAIAHFDVSAHGAVVGCAFGERAETLVVASAQGFAAYALDGRALWFVATQSPVESLSVSRDGRVAVALRDGIVQVYRDTTLMHTSKDAAKVMCRAALSPDGKYVASNTDDKRVVVRELASGKVVQTLPTTGATTALKFSHDGRTLAAAGGGTLDLFDVTAGTSLQSLRRFGSRLIAFSSDDTHLLGDGYQIPVVMRFGDVVTDVDHSVCADAILRSASVPLDLLASSRSAVCDALRFGDHQWNLKEGRTIDALSDVLTTLRRALGALPAALRLEVGSRVRAELALRLKALDHGEPTEAARGAAIANLEGQPELYQAYYRVLSTTSFARDFVSSIERDARALSGQVTGPLSHKIVLQALLRRAERLGIYNKGELATRPTKIKSTDGGLFEAQFIALLQQGKLFFDFALEGTIHGADPHFLQLIAMAEWLSTQPLAPTLPEVMRYMGSAQGIAVWRALCDNTTDASLANPDFAHGLLNALLPPDDGLLRFVKRTEVKRRRALATHTRRP